MAEAFAVSPAAYCVLSVASALAAASAMSRLVYVQEERSREGGARSGPHFEYLRKGPVCYAGVWWCVPCLSRGIAQSLRRGEAVPPTLARPT